jgi:hypothetical protein
MFHTITVLASGGGTSQRIPSRPTEPEKAENGENPPALPGGFSGFVQCWRGAGVSAWCIPGRRSRRSWLLHLLVPQSGRKSFRSKVVRPEMRGGEHAHAELVSHSGRVLQALTYEPSGAERHRLPPGRFHRAARPPVARRPAHTPAPQEDALMSTTCAGLGGRYPTPSGFQSSCERRPTPRRSSAPAATSSLLGSISRTQSHGRSRSSSTASPARRTSPRRPGSAAAS